MKKAIALLRVSDQSQAENMSRTAQLDIIRRELEGRGYVVVESFSEASSGMKYRETLEAAYQYCKRHNRGKKKEDRIQLLAALNWDRWLREFDLSGYWKVNFAEIGVEVNTVLEWYDDSQEGNIYLNALQRAGAHAESRKNSRRTSLGLYYTLKAGFLTSTPPRGYQRSNELDEHGRRKIIHHPELADKYRQAFMLAAQRVPLIAIYRQLGGHRAFGAKQTFYDAMKNEVYAGRKRKKAPYPNMPDLDVALKITPIIDWSTFQQVQMVLNENKSAPRRLLLDDQFFARQSLRCTCCGAVMTSETSKGRQKKYHYYRCANDYRHYRIRRENLHGFISRMMTELTLSDQSMDYLREQAAARIATIRKGVGENVGQLRRMFTTARERQARALDLYVDGKITDKEYENYRSEVDRLSAEIERQLFVQDNQGELMGKVMHFLGHLGNIYQFLPGADRMAMLQMVFPGGFYVDVQKPADAVAHCRTGRINSIFAVMGAETMDYERIKLESPANLPGFPVEGGRPDDNRTAIIAEDFRAFQLFHLRLAA